MKLKLRGKPAKLLVTMIGGVTKYVDSEEYTLFLKDERGISVNIVVSVVFICFSDRIVVSVVVITFVCFLS